jgi:MYXO-CTERM domain-containing protein
MLNTTMGIRFFLPVRLAVCAACFTFAAHGGALSLVAFEAQVVGGGLVSSSSSTTSSSTWGGSYATLSAGDWNYGDSGSGGIFVTPSSSNVFGLTNSKFQCGNAGGCAGLEIVFTLLGVAVSSLPASDNFIIGLDGNTTFGGPLQALYAVSVSGSTLVPVTAPVGSIPLGSTGNFSASNLTTPVTFLCPGCSTSSALVNVNITLLIEPSTSGTPFSVGDTVTLPSSFTVTVADAAPEPASGAIAMLGLAALGAWRRARTSAR